MKREEAEAVLSYLAAGMGQTLAPNQVTVWLPELERLDADAAMKVAMDMVRTYPRMPSLSEFRRSVASEVKNIPEFTHLDLPTGTKVPEWVYVWAWARYVRDPRIERPFPQQYPHIDTAVMMTNEDYRGLRGEWAGAGSPKDLSVLPVPVVP